MEIAHAHMSKSLNSTPFRNFDQRYASIAYLDRQSPTHAISSSIRTRLDTRPAVYTACSISSAAIAVAEGSEMVLTLIGDVSQSLGLARWLFKTAHGTHVQIIAAGRRASIVFMSRFRATSVTRICQPMLSWQIPTHRAKALLTHVGRSSWQ